LKEWGLKNDVKMPFIPGFATNNAHMFYIVAKNENQRINILNKLKDKGILAVFHYLSLHKSPFYKNKYKGESLLMADKYSNCLVRLPLFYQLSKNEIDFIVCTITDK
jgi:dTDP-4-amino-4,6-dideoxygalactose transaminase